MKGEKTKDLLLSLNKFELNKLDDFLASPYFNKDEKIIQLFNLLNKKPDLESEVLWKQLYPNKQYEDVTLRLLISNLNKLIIQFLAVNNMVKTPELLQSQIAIALQSKEFNDFAFPYIGNAETELEKSKERDASYYLKKFRVEEIKMMLLSQKEQRSASNIQLKMDAYLDQFYLINKLKFYCEYLNHNNIWKSTEQPIFMDEIISIVKGSEYLRIPAISIYYHILMTLKNSNDEENYKKLITILKDVRNLFPLSDVRIMYGYAQNYCIKMINEGDLNYLEELFRIYKLVLSKKIIITKEKISPWDYKNITSVALRLKEFDWAFKFIKKYKNSVIEKVGDNAYNFNIARYYFNTKKYKKALKHLQNVIFNDIFYSLDTKALLLKTYYELSEQSALYSLINTFRIQLRRNKVLSQKHISSFLNFITFIRLLSNVSKNDKIGIEKLKNKIEAAKEVADLGWLRQKISDLEKK